MDPNATQNTGSFGAAIGGADVLKQAAQRRGMDASILDQVSPAAATSTEVAPPLEGTGAVPVPSSPQPSGGQQNAGTPFRSAEMEIALKALAQTVRTEEKIAEQALGLR